MPQRKETAEREGSIEAIKTAGISALRSAFTVHNTLGRDGLTTVRTNDHGDTALKADVGCESAVLDVLREKGLPIVVHSEEHGITEIGSKPSRYLGVLDGIDGTAVYKEQFGKGRYATLFGIFKGENPTYDDWLFSGVMAHASGELLYAIKGQEASVLNLTDGTTHPLSRIDTASPDDSKWKKLVASTELDSYLKMTMIGDMLKKLPSDFDIRGDLFSAVACYLDVLRGERAGFIDGTRKLNLEMAATHGLVRSLGGVTMTLDGHEIGDQEYLILGQGKNHIPVITAASEPFAHQLVERVSV